MSSHCASAADEESQLSVLPKLNASEAAIQVHAKQLKQVSKMVQGVYKDGESYVEHGRQMVAMISRYGQELAAIQSPNQEAARESLKQFAELQSKFFDIVRDLNQFYSRDGLQVMEALDSRASTSKADLKRVEKMGDSLESAKKKLAKESSGSSKSSELQDAVSCTQKAMQETGTEVGNSFDALNKEFGLLGAGMYTAFHTSLGNMLKLGKSLHESSEEENKKHRAALGKTEDVSAASVAAGAATGGDGAVDGKVSSALAELVDAERKQVARIECLEKYRSKCESEAKEDEEKSLVEPQVVSAIFLAVKDIATLHRALLDDIDFLGVARKDLSEAEAAALSAKQKQQPAVSSEGTLGYLCKVFGSRLAQMEAAYTLYLEQLGVALGTLERAKKGKKSFGSMLNKCAQQTIVYGMFPLDQLLPLPGRYPISVKALLQCVLDASSEVDAAWMDFYEMMQSLDELGKRLARVRVDGENLKTLMDVKDKINGYESDLAEIGRVFYFEENLTCVQHTLEEQQLPALGFAALASPRPVGEPKLVDDQVYHVLLFNDMVMVASKPTGVKQASTFILHENYNFVVAYPVTNMVVVPIQDTPDVKYMLKMIVNERNTVIWAAASEALKTDWLDKFKYATSSWRREQVFGVAPEEVMKRASLRETGVVPFVLQDAVEYVLAKGLTAEGIFRISGSSKTMTLLRLRLNTGHTIEYPDPFTAAAMIKQWLSALPVPVMQPHLYTQWQEAAALPNRAESVEAMQAVVKKLPKMAKFILYIICDLARRIVERTAENRMTYQNLSIVLVPSLMRVPESQELASTKRLDTLEKVLMLSELIFPGVKEEMTEVALQNKVYKELTLQRKREALDAIRTQHMREKSILSSETVSAAEWMQRRKEELAAQQQKEEEEAEARAAKEREEMLAKQMEEYEARLREEEERKQEEEARKARKEARSREAESEARQEFDVREKKVREMAERAEREAREVEEREAAQHEAARKRRAEEEARRRKAAEEEAAAAAAAADYGDDVCAGCGKDIDEDDEDAFDALEKTWHADCFVCQKCKKKLGSEFKGKSNRPYCSGCYAELFCPLCTGCGKPITGSVLKALDSTWHKQCFVCAKCGKPVTGDFTSTPDGKPLCC